MIENMKVRRFKEEDAQEVRNLIVRNFLEVNSKDYGISAMEKLSKAYDAEKVLNVASYAHMYVFEFDGKIIGTGSISSFWGSETESILLSIFVLPEFHGKGVGRKIINILETDEFYVRASRIEIPASITAIQRFLGAELGTDLFQLLAALQHSGQAALGHHGGEIRQRGAVVRPVAEQVDAVGALIVVGGQLSGRDEVDAVLHRMGVGVPHALDGIVVRNRQVGHPRAGRQKR